MLVSGNEAWIKKAEFYGTQAREDQPFYEHIEYGYNYRMSNVLAAIGVAQMEVLNQRVQKRREIFSWYQELTAELDEIAFMPEIAQSQGNRWLTTLTFKKHDPQLIIEALNKANIESRMLWKPMHLQPLFKDATSFLNGTSETLFQRGLCLPSGTQMEKRDVENVVDVMKDIL